MGVLDVKRSPRQAPGTSGSTKESAEKEGHTWAIGSLQIFVKRYHCSSIIVFKMYV